MKKIVTAALVASVLAAQAASAIAAPAAPDRAGSPVGKAENAVSTPLLLGLFAALAAGIFVIVEENENDDGPVSP